MSDEPTPKDQKPTDAAPAIGGWVMPEPVFRSSEGHTPKSASIGGQEEVDTDVPALDPMDITLDASDELANAETDEIAAPVPAAIAPPQASNKSGCAKNVVVILSVIGFIAAAVVVAVVYYLFYFRPADTSTF
jgi:hypothetical protein